MKEIRSDKFLELWDKIANDENLSPTAMCEYIGLNGSARSAWKSGKSKTIRPKVLRLLSDNLGYEIDVDEKGEPYISRHNRVARRVREKSAPYIARKLPVIHNVKIINNSVIFETNEGIAPLDELETSETKYCFLVPDNSMSPRYNQGDYVIVDITESPISNEYAVVISKKTDNYLIRLYREVSGGAIHLIPLDRYQETIILHGEDILHRLRIIGTRERGM